MPIESTAGTSRPARPMPMPNHPCSLGPLVPVTPTSLVSLLGHGTFRTQLDVTRTCPTSNAQPATCNHTAPLAIRPPRARCVPLRSSVHICRLNRHALRANGSRQYALARRSPLRGRPSQSPTNGDSAFLTRALRAPAALLSRHALRASVPSSRRVMEPSSRRIGESSFELRPLPPARLLSTTEASYRIDPPCGRWRHHSRRPRRPSPPSFATLAMAPSRWPRCPRRAAALEPLPSPPCLCSFGYSFFAASPPPQPPTPPPLRRPPSPTSASLPPWSAPPLLHYIYIILLSRDFKSAISEASRCTRSD